VTLLAFRLRVRTRISIVRNGVRYVMDVGRFADCVMGHTPGDESHCVPRRGLTTRMTHIPAVLSEARPYLLMLNQRRVWD